MTCKERVYEPGGWYHHECGRKATSADGRFCGIHDPERKKARAAKRGPTRFEREIAEIHARAQRTEELNTFLRLLADFAGDARCWSGSGTFNIAEKAKELLERKP